MSSQRVLVEFSEIPLLVNQLTHRHPPFCDGTILRGTYLISLNFVTSLTVIDAFIAIRQLAITTKTYLDSSSRAQCFFHHSSASFKINLSLHVHIPLFLALLGAL